MTWFFAVLQTALAACIMLHATAQDNPFGETMASPTMPPPTVESAAEAGSPPIAEVQDPLPSANHGRRLGDAIEGFEIAFKDSNGTDMQGGEDIDKIVLGFTFGSTTGASNAAEITVPSSVFTVGLALTVSLDSGRRLAGDDAYGRRLSAACEVQSAAVQVCTGNPSQVCLRLVVARAAGAGGGDCQAGDVVSPTSVTGNLPSMPAGRVHVEVQMYQGSTPVPGAIARQTIDILDANGVAISDPITIYKGKKTKFWLPLEGEHLLVQTPDLGIFASVFEGPRADLQWFDRFIIKLPDGRKVLEVGVKRESINQNNTASRNHRVFSQLDIKFTNSQEPLRKLERSLYSLGGGAVKVAVGTQKFDPPRLHGQPITEFVNVETASISFVLVASHAGNEFDDLELQKKHAHMDWITRDMVGSHKFIGILPQIWGVQQPLSAEVAAMLQAPTESAQICVDV